MPGFVPRFGAGGLYDLYEKSWALVNTSAREGMPYTFLEAAAWGCAILSELDPDGFAKRFGYRVKDGDYAAGLDWLLKDENWKRRGRAGAEQVAAVFGEESSLRAHMEHYARLREGRERVSTVKS
jgi:glycosyltransferase involved in cell wall biosynthesis